MRSPSVNGAAARSPRLVKRRGGTVGGGGKAGGADGGGPAGVDRGGGRAGLAEIQRARMVMAMAELVRERGVAATTVAHVVTQSGVSRRTFYELFSDRDDCFRAAFDLAVQRAAERVLPAYREPDGWAKRMRAGLCALLEFLEDEPDLGALCVVDSLGAGRQALERRAALVGVLIDVVDTGRLEARAGAKTTRLTAEGVVGAVLGVLHARLGGLRPSEVDRANGSASHRSSGGRGGERPAVVCDERLVDLLGPLMGMIVLPYLGPAAAARETARPTPRRAPSAPRQGDPLRDLDMRLTYRTVRVLLAVASLPDASNREVADASGIGDQGQISKLLTRLEHLGVLRNESVGASRGAPNAWSLTLRGEEIVGVIRQQAVAQDG